MWNRLLTAVGIYVLIPFLYISRYVHPSADDFMHALDWPRYGFGEIVKKICLEWSGRYFSQIIYKYNPTVYHSLPGYRLFSIAWILLTGVRSPSPPSILVSG